MLHMQTAATLATKRETRLASHSSSTRRRLGSRLDMLGASRVSEEAGLSLPA